MTSSDLLASFAVGPANAMETVLSLNSPEQTIRRNRSSRLRRRTEDGCGNASSVTLPATWRRSRSSDRTSAHSLFGGDLHISNDSPAYLCGDALEPEEPVTPEHVPVSPVEPGTDETSAPSEALRSLIMNGSLGPKVDGDSQEWVLPQLSASISAMVKSGHGVEVCEIVVMSAKRNDKHQLPIIAPRMAAFALGCCVAIGDQHTRAAALLGGMALETCEEFRTTFADMSSSIEAIMHRCSSSAPSPEADINDDLLHMLVAECTEEAGHSTKRASDLDRPQHKAVHRGDSALDIITRRKKAPAPTRPIDSDEHITF